MELMPIYSIRMQCYGSVLYHAIVQHCQQDNFMSQTLPLTKHYGALDQNHNRKHVGWIIVALLPCRYHSSCLWLMTSLGEKYLVDGVGDSGVAILATWICHVVKGPIPDITVGNPIHYLKILVATSLQFENIQGSSLLQTFDLLVAN